MRQSQCQHFIKVPDEVGRIVCGNLVSGHSAKHRIRPEGFLAGFCTEVDNLLRHSLEVDDVALEDLFAFKQRELGDDFDTYPNGLRAALRQAPKVILVGEMRDRDTVEIALTAAETGHLVLSTLHTIDAGQTISRILGMFQREEEKQLRLRLAETLRYVVSQRLAPKREGGGRTLLLEIMGNSLRTKETIALGESDGREFYDIIQDAAPFGWTTFDQSITRAFESGLITEETANLYATRKGVMQRNLDQIKKQRGLGSEKNTGLRLDTPEPPSKKTTSPRGLFGI